MTKTEESGGNSLSRRVLAARRQMTRGMHSSRHCRHPRCAHTRGYAMSEEVEEMTYRAHCSHLLKWTRRDAICLLSTSR
jgi:hypothetical protein